MAISLDNEFLVDTHEAMKSISAENDRRRALGDTGDLRLAWIENGMHKAPIYELPAGVARELAEQYKKYMALDFVKDPETKALYATYRIFAERGRRRD